MELASLWHHNSHGKQESQKAPHLDCFSDSAAIAWLCHSGSRESSSRSEQLIHSDAYEVRKTFLLTNHGICMEAMITLVADSHVSGSSM